MIRVLRQVLIVCLLCLPVTGVPAAQSIESQRQDFKDARDAIRKGSVTRYRQLRSKLDSYVLVGYLDYEYLKRQLDKPRVDEYRDFFNRYSDSPISDRLREKWLIILARQGRWKLFLEFYRPSKNKELACYEALALQNLGRREEANTATEKLWLVGKSQPRTCDQVFKNWRASGAASTDVIWERIRLAMHKRRPNLARYLAKFLGPSERTWVERWYRMYRQPARMLEHADYQNDTPLVREIVLHGLERLARIDAMEAGKHWQQTRGRYTFSEEDIGKIERRIALSSATQRLADAYPLLEKVDVKWADDDVLDWRVRSALVANNWDAVLRSVDSMPLERRQKNNWQYWRARALQQLGNNQESNSIYARLALDFSYQGLLAADRLGVPYALDGKRLVSSKEEQAQLRLIPGIARAEELYAIGMTIDARREWQRTIKQMDKRQLQVAAMLASQLGWHDRAVLTIGRTDTLDDLKLRYPIVFEKQVLQHASHNKIEAAWVFGVLRQESAYMTDARSHAGALGLMQLMPSTARSEAKHLRIRLGGHHEILNVDKNIRLGTAHLRRVLDINQGHQVLATASYNAGASRVKSWLPDADVEADIWIENIPFQETRKYVKKVLSTTAVFEKHLDQDVTPIEKRLLTIKPRS